MKKFLAILLFAFTTTAFAQHRNHGHYHYHHYHRHHGHGSNMDWLVPAVIGGAVVYGITRAQQPQPVVVQPPPTVYIPPGMPVPPVGYRYEQILDGNCNCYRWFLVQG